MQEKILIEVDGYRIIDTHNLKTKSTRDKIVALWQRNNILPSGIDPYQRADQVVTAALNNNDEIIGVVTAYPQTLAIPLKLKDKHVFVYRQFIQLADQQFSVMHHLSDQAVRLLDGTTGIDGLYMQTENRKMMRRGFRKYFSRRGFELIDSPRIAEDTWFRDYSKLPAS